MIIFGKWPLWIAIGMVTLAIALSIAAAGHIVLAALLVILVVVGAYYSLRGDTSY